MYNFIVFGHSGVGKSKLLMDEAERQGMSYEEFLKKFNLFDTDESKEKINMQKEESCKKEEFRMNAIREAYWNATDEKDFSSEFGRMHDAMVDTVMNDKRPTREQVKALFMIIFAVVAMLGFISIFADGIFDHKTDTALLPDETKFVADMENMQNTGLVARQHVNINTPCNHAGDFKTTFDDILVVCNDGKWIFPRN